MNDTGAYTNIKSLVKFKYQGQGFSFLPRQPVHSLLAGQKTSRLRGRGINFEEIRTYLPGDDVRNIDWKVTARMRKPHTRVYTEDRDRPTLLVVDQRINMFFGSKRAMKSVVAAEAAALGAWRVVCVGDRVGAVIFNDTEIESIPPHRSNKTVLNILGSIVRMNQKLTTKHETVSQSAKLNEALKNVSRLAKHDYLICIISDFDGANEDTQRMMTRLARHNDVIVGFVYDDLETEIPDLGRVIIGDGNKQIEFDTSDQSLRQRYKDEFADRLAIAKKFLMQRKVPIIPLNTEIPVAEQLRKVLGYRPRGNS